MMQMSARNAFGVRYVFDGRSHDRLAQRSSGLRMLLGPSPPSNVRRSIAPSVVGTPAPHAAAPTARAVSFIGAKRTFAKHRRLLSAKTRNQPKAKPLDARAVRFSEPRRGYAWSLGSALATSRAYLANNSVTS